MSDPSQKRRHKCDARKFHELIVSNEQSNNRNYRLQVQPPSKSTQENTTNNFDQQKLSQYQNSKSTVKPLLDSITPEPLLISKPYEKSKSQRRTRHKQSDRENNLSDDDAGENSNMSPEKIDFDRSTIDIRVPTQEHLLALKHSFQKILKERFLCSQSLKQRETVFRKLYEIISKVQPDCKINLYGSIHFECCLEKPGIMDIDVQLKETSQYDSLKVLLDVIKSSDLCKEIQIDTDNKPSCINLITSEPVLRVKITSGYNRGLYLSKLIRLYTKFDNRVIKLLRLFRILSKTCNIDKPEIGTLHPVVFHIMVIHFLQQLVPPVLPCLHEYAFGIDNVPITLNESQYTEFFNVCEKYSQEWKSTNTTTVEMLFLQLLSYYVKTFCAKQFVVSIQTKMPVMKLDKNWRSRKLLVEDPTDIKRSLCQTMQSPRSIDYFRGTLNASINYFARKQKKRNLETNSYGNSIEIPDDDLIEVVSHEINDVPKIEPFNSLHNSYKLFYKNLPTTVVRDVNIKQGRVLEYYRHTFNDENDLLSKGIIQMKGSNGKFNDLIDPDIQEAFQHDLENNFETMDENDDDENQNHSHLLQRIISDECDPEQFLNDSLQENNNDQQAELEDECQRSDTEQESLKGDSVATMNDAQQGNLIIDNTEELDEKFNECLLIGDIPVELCVSKENNVQASDSLPINVKVESGTNDKQINDSRVPSPFTLSIEFEEFIDNEQLTVQNNNCTNNISELYYDFRPENFNAEQGAPYVCTTCNGIGHLKTECPELVIPNIVDLPPMNEPWMKVLTELCSYISDRLKPKDRDEENRKKILKQLEKQFQKDYPDCQLHAFGSFYNGFGFCQSDLDVCIVFKDEREKNNDEVIRIMQRILRAMRSSNLFDGVQPVLQAKVPIIRTRHRYFHIDIDISLHNMLAIENTRLLKTYTEIDPRVSQLGYMIKHLAKLCSIGDASRGTLSSYAYIIMLLHFLQQTQPPVLPVLQQLNNSTEKAMYKKCSKWNVYFFDNISELKMIWKQENTLSTGALWIEFLRFYTEQFNYDEHVVTIRQIEPLLKHEKGWFRQTISIEDPFELSHNLAGGLSPRNWIIIRRVFISARLRFAKQLNNIDLFNPDMSLVEEKLFDIDDLCPANAPKRCEWCKGPYHIRKHCPKLASLANEKEKKNRAKTNYGEPPVYNNNHARFLSNNIPENSHGNLYRNGYNQSKTASSDQRFSRHKSNENFRELNKSSSNSVEQSVKNLRGNNEIRRACFKCGSFDHLKAACPSLQKGHVFQQQKKS